MSALIGSLGPGKLLQSLTISNLGNVDIESPFSQAGYERLIIKASSVVPQTHDVTLYARFKVGGAYASANYTFVLDQTASASYLGLTNSSASQASILTGIPNVSTCGCDFEVVIDAHIGTSIKKSIKWDSKVIPDAGNAPRKGDGRATLHAVGAMQGIRFFMSSGNIVSGKIEVYGEK